MKLLYFSPVNFGWIKQRPQYMATELAGLGVDVDYISFTPFPQKILSFNETLPDHFNVHDIRVWPGSLYSAAVRYLNGLFLKNILQYGYDRIVLTHPMQLCFFGKKAPGPDRLVYECMDNIPEFYSGKVRDRVREWEGALCRAAGAVAVSSGYLKDRLTGEYHLESQKVTVIPNALDAAELVSAPDVSLRKPNIVYIGTVGEWFDFETINRFSTENPEYTVYVAGPAAASVSGRFAKNKNIVLLGTVPHARIGGYIKAADVLVIPFCVNELIRAVNPVKIYEYLAFRKNIVTSYWKELDSFQPYGGIAFYRTYDDFENAVKAHAVAASYRLDTGFIADHTWKQRADSLYALLERIPAFEKD